MHVREIWRYPVKSMAGEQVQTTAIGPQGVAGDRLVYVVGSDGQILSSRTKPRLLGHQATLDPRGKVLVDGLPWDSAEVAAKVRVAAGDGARLVRADGPERFDILPLLVVTDGALAVFGHDYRRLRPNLVIAGVQDLTERTWEYSLLAAGDAVIVLADLRRRCVMTTFDPDTQEKDPDVLRDINARFGGTFALNAWTGRTGSFSVGDEVHRIEAAPADVLEPPLLGRYA